MVAKLSLMACALMGASRGYWNWDISNAKPAAQIPMSSTAYEYWIGKGAAYEHCQLTIEYAMMGYLPQFVPVVQQGTAQAN